jgi:GGDEF domain-containing protein
MSGSVLSPAEAIAQMDAEDAAAGKPAVPQTPAAPTDSPAPFAVRSPADAVAQMDEEDRQLARLMRFRAANDATAPERRAQVLRYAAATQLPPEVVERDFDNVKRKVDAAKVDWEQLRREQPGLAQYLDDRPEGHPLAQSDLQHLGAAEWSLKAPMLGLRDAATGAFVDLGKALVEGLPQGAELQQQNAKALAEGKVGAAPEQLKNVQAITDWIRDLATSHEQLVSNRGTYGAQTLPGKMLVGSAKAVPVLVENAAAGAYAGPAGIFALNYGLGQAQLHEQLTNYQDPATGQKLDPAVVNTASEVGGLVNGALMVAPVGKLVGVFGKGAAAIPFAKQLTQRFAADAVEKVLVQPGATALMKRAASEWGAHTVTAAVAVGLQGATMQGTEEAAKSASGLKANPEKVAEAFATHFAAGLRDMALLSATGPGQEFLSDYRRQAESRAAAGRFGQLVTAAGESKMRALAPEEFERAVGAMAAQPGAAKTVGVPVEAWNTYWQQQKVDPGQVAEQLLGDGGKAYAEASATKGDLVVPSERLVARLPEHLLGLREDVRLGEGVLTPREAKAEQVLLQSRLEEQAKARGAELDVGKAEVEAFIRDQARAAGIPKADAEANAKLVAEYAGTMALRTGLSVAEAARLGGLDRLSIQGPKGAEVAAAARERFAQFLTGPSASRRLADRLATMSPEARAREFYVDPVTGLRNRRAFDATPAPEGKQVAVVTLPDVKAVNDHPEGGHDKANELLRVAGAALGDPAAARSGTNFLLHVADQAELDQVLARVRAALPDQRLAVEGALGATPQEAGKALDARVDQRRAAGDLPARGQVPGGVEVAKLAFPGGRAATTVPPELVAELGGLSHEEYFRKAYQDEKSPGILSREGWDALPRKAYVASVDLRGLKDLNTRLGKAAGDEVLRQFGEIASHFGGSSFDFAHLSGDEYAAQADDPEQLQRYLDRLRGKAQTHIRFEIEKPNGTSEEVIGADFRSGIARGSYGAADRALNEAKLREQAGAAPTAQASRDSRGLQAQGDQDRGHGDLAGGGEPLGRGTPAPGEGRPDQGGAVAGGQALRGAVAEGPGDAGGAVLAGTAPGGSGVASLERGDRGGRRDARRLLGDPRGSGGDLAGGGEDRSGPQDSAVGPLGRGAAPQGFPGAEFQQPAHVGEDTSFDVAHLEGAPVTLTSGMREARAAVERMRGENRTAAQAFLDYAIGLTDKRPEISPALERRLAEYGVVDPAGFTFDESGRDLSRAIGGRKKLNAEPASLREYRLRRTGQYRAYGDQYEQPGFHGSPHEFDRFSLHALGSGEGNQDQGWGLYFASKREVAEHYQEALAGGTRALLAGKPPEQLPDAERRALGVVTAVRDFATPTRLPWADALERAKAHQRELVDSGGSSAVEAAQILQTLESWSPEQLGNERRGHLYQVEVPEDERLLEYEKPLNAQSELVQRAARGLAVEHQLGDPGDMSGRDLYAALVRKLGSAQAASVALRDAGVPGLRYLDAESRARTGQESHNYVIWDERAITRTERLYQPGEPGGGDRPPPRGSIRFSVDPSGKPVDFAIEALRGDRSTLAHETAHFLSWSLHELATSDLAGADLKGDYDALLKWAGYKDAADRVADHDAAREEKFSHAWEQYLAEGKAPSPAVERVFSRFKEWMVRIYRGLSGIGAQYKAQHGEDLQLSDEVRGVFNRLLAADEGLTRARDESGQAQQPEASAMAGMTPAEQEAYRKAFADARASADAETLQRMAELEKGEVAQARARISTEVAAELDQQPRYRLWRFLQRGELADGQGGALLGKAIPELLLDADGRPLRLSRAAVREQFGQRVEEALRPLLAKDGGVTADQLAPLFGYENGQDMVSELYNSTPRDQVLQEKTQERVDAQYGPALQHIRDAATAAVHGDAAARATLLALRGLAKQVDPTQARRLRSISLETLKDTAARLVGETPVGALNPERYQRAERATTRRAERLWGAGKKAEALDEREAALLNQVLYRAARDRQASLEEARQHLEGFSEAQRAALGKADPSYRDVHDLLLQAVELGPGPEDKATALGLDAMLVRAKEDAQELDFDVALVRGLLAEPAPWDRLTADEAQAVADASANIRTAARRRNEVTLAGKTQTKDAFFARLKEHLANRKPLPPAAYTQRERTLAEKAGSLKRGVESDLMDVGETLAHMLDAGERNGPAHELLVDGRLAARDAEVKLTKDVLEKVHAAYRAIPEDMKKLAGTKVPGLEQLLPSPDPERVRAPSTRDALYVLFLNQGNEGNRQRIRDGNGWSDEQVQRALNLLKPEETKFLQGILDVVDRGLWEQLAKVYEGRTGLPLEKVHATEISVNGETFRGGYFPIRYDERSSRPGELQADAEAVAGLFQGNYRKAAVSSGHTKERAEKVDAAVLLDWNVLPAHLAQVIHDITYGDWVRQAGSLVLDQRFKDAAATYLGPERRAQLVPWLQDVANARADSAAGALSQAARTIGGAARGRLAVAALAFNLKAFGLHTFDPWKAVWEDVGMHRIGAAYVKVMAPWNWGQLRELGLSKEIAAREVNFKEDLRRTLNAAGLGEPGLWRKLGETQFRMYEWIDRFTGRVTFKAAFDAARAEGLSDADAARRGDDAVRRVLASHDIAEKPRLMRSKSGWGAIVMFYGYANRGWNQRFRARDDIARLWGNEEATSKDKAAAVATYAAKMLALAVIGTGAAYMAGRGPKKKDDWEQWAVTQVALEPLHEWPLIGGIAEKVAKGERADARTEPGLAYMLDTINRIEDLVHKAGNNSLSAEEKLWAGVDSLLGLTLGGQVQETADYAHKLATGQARPRGPGDVASGLIYGERKEPVRTPLTDAQDLISR